MSVVYNQTTETRLSALKIVIHSSIIGRHILFMRMVDDFTLGCYPNTELTKSPRFVAANFDTV